MNPAQPTSASKDALKENNAGTGLKVAVFATLLICSGLSGLKAYLSASGDDAYNAGYFVGGLLTPFIFCGIIVALFSISKSLRQERMRYRIAMAVSLLLLVTQCTTTMGELSKRGASETIRVTAKAAAPMTPADIETIRSKAAAFETGVGQGDISVFQTLFDTDALLARAVDGLTVSSQFVAGVKKGMQERGVLAPIFTPMIQLISEGGGSYRLLRITEEGNVVKALYRVRMDGGINYHEWLFQKNDDGVLAIVDLTVFTTGESISQTVRHNALLPAAADQDSAEAKTMLQIFDASKRISLLALQQSFKEAAQLYQGLPAEAQNHKLVLLPYISVAQALGDDAYIAAMTQFIANYPNDPAQAILALDFYIIKKDFEKAQASIDRLDAAVKDPFLNTLRSNVFNMMQEFDKAEAAAKAALDAGEKTSETYWALLSSLVYQKKFEEAIPVVELISSKFDEAVDPQVEDAAFQAFISSEPYQRWLNA